MNNSILLVDDEVNVLAALKRALMEEPYEVFVATSGDEALRLMAAQRFKVVVSDEQMPGISGAIFLAKVREQYPDTVRIMLTGHASVESTMKAVNSGEIYRFFTKPWNDHELILALRSAIEKFDMEVERRRLLATVKSQASELRGLEQRYPGITCVEKDDLGAVLLPEVSDEEIEKIIRECSRELSEP
ncbi:response regulator [Geobacter argillaceus]|uniref:Response regulator receiver domain-containing protein n=1 Tax=Geobacter argillaceus TaxID=345631 RepID=A0A562VNU6_9BACT|nr:response regulator [Geobacter argillaceus]TWJ19451.1 response regulator receiver domain-containing protein [Geobacter argillaceus]